MQSSDYELVAQIKATEGESQKIPLGVLWLRYENQVHKQWAILRRQMNNSSLVLELRDDFYSEAYIAFHKAVTAVDLSKVKDEKWRFVGYFHFYLQNLRNDMIGKLLKQFKQETSLYVETSEGEVSREELMPVTIPEQMQNNPETAMLESASKANVVAAVTRCMQTWDERRRAIFKLRQQGLAKGEVATRLGVHPATITYHLQVMQKDLEKELRAL